MNLYTDEVGVTILLTVFETTGTPFDLTGWTVTMKLSGAGERTMTLSNQTTNKGECTYVTVANDFAAGEYRAQLRGTKGADVFRTTEAVLEVLAVVA